MPIRPVRSTRSRLAVAVLSVSAVLAGAACANGSDGLASPAVSAAGPTDQAFDAFDRSLRDRSGTDDLPILGLVVRGGNTVFERSHGGMERTTPIRIASASKWLTAATVMALVDDGALALDAPVSSVLPRFDGDKSSITLRHLLSHTSGIGNNACIWEPDITMEACVDAIADDDLIEAPGVRFHYGNTSFQVAARMVEVAGGDTFSEVFRRRIAEPLGMTGTRFDGGDPGRTPTPAASGESTADDYARFLAMLLAGGDLDGARVLTRSSVDEILRTQVDGRENDADGAVVITGIPDYGLGCWLDEIGDDGSATVASGSGSLGAYPFVDRSTSTFGMVWVEDGAHGDGRAVERSQAQVGLALDAAARSAGPPTTS